jgi:plasmid maintenance system antidote protein VapI
MNLDQKPSESRSQQQETRNKGFNALQVTLLVLLAIGITVGVTIWAMNSLFPSKFEPVVLNSKEQQALDQKLETFERFKTDVDRRGRPSRATLETDPDTGALIPEAYSEAGASREIRFSEKELNALLANNTDLATRLAIDLSDNLASAKLLVHLDEDLPLLGGNTVKLSAGVELAYATGKPIVKLRGISVWGVPMPNAWMGGIKNVDLIQEFGQEPGFWQAFADGVELIEVRQGHLYIQLKE